MSKACWALSGNPPLLGLEAPAILLMGTHEKERAPAAGLALGHFLSGYVDK